MSQEARILEFLQDRQWHHVQAIMEYVEPGSRNVAVRNRISELNKTLPRLGYFINSRPAGSGDNEHEYRLEPYGAAPELGLNVRHTERH